MTFKAKGGDFMYNKAIIVGRLTADPELRQTPNGVAVTSFSLAVDRPYTPKGGERQVDFLDIVAWRQTAEFICRYFSKGRPILIDGAIQTRQYTDKSGNSRRVWEIVADSAHFVGSKQETSANGEYSGMPASLESPAGYSSGSVDDFAEMDDDGDLPF